ncbi:MAG TPA: MFS transporter [Actinomycetes bacterium]|nr:MFS transporter [Actinomycetes bacterium]
MSSLVDRIAPPRMGSSFRWLLASSTASNIGDGLALAAGPLLVASQTSNAVLVAMAVLLQRLPWLLLGLYAGAVADRVDRRLLVMASDGIRALVVGVLCLTIVTGEVSIAVVLVTMLLLGVAEVFADTTGQTLLPMLVKPEDLGIGNARFQASSLVANQIVGPPLGAFLFAAGMAWPFAGQAVLVAFGVLLVARVATPKGAVRDVEGTHIVSDIVEGVRWLMNHNAVRTLALVMFVFNVTWGAAWSVMVLYALHHLHMSEVGFAFLTTAAAIGGLAGTLSFGWIERRFDLATVMRACLLLEVLTHLSLALTTLGWVATLVMVVFGGYAFVWATVSQTVRQRATPKALQGRVGSAYMVALFGGLVIGQGLGGWIAETWGLTAPFWFAFVGSGLTLAVVWRQLGYVAHAEAEPA